MSFAGGVAALATRFAQEINNLRTEVPSIIVLDANEAVPSGTPVDTIIVRRPA